MNDIYEINDNHSKNHSKSVSLSLLNKKLTKFFINISGGSSRIRHLFEKKN